LVFSEVTFFVPLVDIHTWNIDVCKDTS
jgi:hypothetical protein